jgi:putative ABC transport system permease protein
VIDDFPVTSHFKYDFLMTLAGQEFWNGEQSNWQASNYIDYVLLREGTNVEDTEQMMASLLKNHFIPFAVKNGGAREEMDWLNSMRFILQPVQEIYLNKDDMFDGSQHGDPRYNWLFSAIAIFILLIACVNFINLSTARSAGRAREVGLRKVVGSLRVSLINQFLTESVLFSLFSFIIGALLAWVLLPYFNTLMQRSLIFPWNAWWFVPVIALGAVFIGILSGAYPAFYLSSFQPSQVLKGNTSGAGRNTLTRSLLVVFQFTISIILIVGTFVINRQMDYIMNKKLGFDKEQVLLLEGAHTLGDQAIVFKNELLRLPEVQYASISSYLPVTGSQRNGGGMWLEGMTDEEQISSQHWSVDHDYIKTMGLTILKGRDFAEEIPSDSQAMIVNESLVKALQLKEPIGAKIFNWLGDWTVIGVIEDFHSETMRRGIEPMGLFIRKSANTVSVKLNTIDMQAAISSVTKIWDTFSPHQSIRFSFLDQRYEQMYADVRRMGWMFASFAILAIAIACLGLFALSAFMVEQRGKEVCIRLVLGATLRNIFNLLTLNFVRLVLISIALAIPIAWYVTHKWLEDFSYKIEITWDVFALAGVAAILITLLTISYQSIRAALMKPVEGLRSE